MLTTLLAEHGLVPDWAVRQGIRRLLRLRLREEASNQQSGATQAFLASMAQAPVALIPQKANEQHYTVPAAFYQRVLGAHLKYSSGWWDDTTPELDAAEAKMLALTCERAQLADGQRILELGCGWGSLSLWMARHFPAATILAVSNSPTQRAYIEDVARTEGLANLRVLTADMNEFEPVKYGEFDRVVSVEMFEHMRNWAALLGKVEAALAPDGRMFMHVFAHQRYLYPFEEQGQDNWMGRHFFSGGIMPSMDLIDQVGAPLAVEARWTVEGTHYQKTAEAWLSRLDAARADVEAIFAAAGDPKPALMAQRWRMFFMACAEQFGFDGGSQWQVVHWRLQRRRQPRGTGAY